MASIKYEDEAHTQLVFRWLCRSCHRKWDRFDPKTETRQRGLDL